MGHNDVTILSTVFADIVSPNLRNLVCGIDTRVFRVDIRLNEVDLEKRPEQMENACPVKHTRMS